MVRQRAAQITSEALAHHSAPEILEIARRELADYIKSLAETLAGIGDYGIAEPSLLAIDMIRAALSEVDYDEIASNVLSES